MPDILNRLGREVLIADGAMGTMLQRAGVPAEQCPEQLNITNPEVVLGVHQSYVTVGAECVTTNTFGGSRTKLAEYGLAGEVEALNREAVRLARRAGAQHILADVGPSGLVLEPIGRAAFDEVFEVFAEQVAALAAEGPDAILLETFTDIAEARCALLAARSVTDLPVFVTCTFGTSGRTELSGTDPATAATILGCLGAAAVGVNCGLGPEGMLPLVQQMSAATDLPLIVQPNAGLPRLEDGATVYPGTPDEMGEHAARFVEGGAAIVGSCCGSTPAFTGAIVDFAKRLQVRSDRVRPAGVAIAGPRGVARIGAGGLTVIGERINPTGRKALAASLREGSMEIVRSLAVAQQHDGADALDVNVGAAGVDAAEALPAAVLALTSLSDLPLVMDTTDEAALAKALRVYPGRALINSVNGGEASMRTVLPLAAEYGAAVVVLALDDDGIPATADGRLAIVERVRAAAHEAGLTDDDLVADCLVMTVATDPGAPTTTLDAVRRVKDELGLATMLGVSNVSHGLPGRSELNETFLAMAADAGLDAAILNPSEAEVRRTDAAVDVLTGRDAQASAWIARVAAQEQAPPPAEEPPADAGPEDLLADAIRRGDGDSAPRLVDAVLGNGLDPRDVIATVLTPAIRRLGDAYARGEVFLPQLMVSADAMKAAVERVKQALPEGDRAAEGRVVFATVKGDVHSIGKDICVSLLESQGYAVEDLGVDVDAVLVAESARMADVVCLSALMTTTLPSMAGAVAAVREAAPDVAVLVGGAVVTREWAESIGAGYGADAPACVTLVAEAVAGGAAR